MIEFEFGVEDLAQTSFSISPMDHLLVGAIRPDLRHYGGPSSGQSRWWRSIRGHIPASARPFLELVNAGGPAVPDFLAADTCTYRRNLTDELDAIMAVTDEQICADIGRYTRGPQPPVVHRLRNDGRTALREVLKGIHAFHRACMAADWRDIERLLEADIRAHALLQAKEGTAAMLTRLHPRLAWSPSGTLAYSEPSWALDSAHHPLGGLGLHDPVHHPLESRGLQLRPNLFTQDPGYLLHPGRPTVLVYPTVPSADPAQRPDTDGLVVLLGASRARAARVIAQAPCTTTELAAALAISPPAASVLASALRTGGLIATTRQGKHVHHTLSDLGSQFLTANPPPR